MLKTCQSIIMSVLRVTRHIESVMKCVVIVDRQVSNEEVKV